MTTSNATAAAATTTTNNDLEQIRINLGTDPNLRTLPRTGELNAIKTEQRSLNVDRSIN